MCLRYDNRYADGNGKPGNRGGPSPTSLPGHPPTLCTTHRLKFSGRKHRLRSSPAHSWTPTMPKMKKTKKQSSRTLPSMGKVSSSNVTRMRMPVGAEATLGTPGWPRWADCQGPGSIPRGAHWNGGGPPPAGGETNIHFFLPERPLQPPAHINLCAVPPPKSQSNCALSSTSLSQHHPGVDDITPNLQMRSLRLTEVTWLAQYQSC